MFHPHDAFAGLIEHLLSAARGTRLQDGGAPREGVARLDRALPFQRVDARRAKAARIDEQPLAEHAHEDRANMPARGDEAADLLRRRGGFVEMKGLRIEFSREG